MAMHKKLILHNLLWFCLLVVLAALMVFWPRIAGNGMTPPAFSRAPLVVESADGRKIPFTVEVAETPQQEQRGLMFRKSLPEGEGMIFIYNNESAAMWMKNTLIPLDMLFVRADGTIEKIAHAEPLDLTPIKSKGPVRYVVEIGGGEAAKRGIREGDKVLYSAPDGAP